MSQNSISAVKNRGYYTNDLVISMVVAAVFNRDPIKLSSAPSSIKKSGRITKTGDMLQWIVLLSVLL